MVIVHIGYHKSGTTYLQNNIFPYLSIPYYGYFESQLAFKDIAGKSILDFSPSDVHLQNGLYSYEALVGPLFYNSGINKKEIALKLSLCGVDRVIITIRNQNDAINSIYRQYIQEGGVANFKTFLSQKIFDLSYCNYYPLIECYFALFGQSNILVLLNEQIREEKTEVIKKIAKFTSSKLKKKNLGIGLCSPIIHCLILV